MNRFIVLGMIITAFAFEAQAQQPTPAKRSQANTAQVKSSGKSNRTVVRTQAAASSEPKVRTAVAKQTTNQEAAIGSGVRTPNSQVVKASAQQEVIYDEHVPMPIAESNAVCESMPSASCDSCDSMSCGGTCGPMTFSTARGFSICNPPAGSRQLAICLPSHGWVQLDYLHWFQDGMDVPALVSTGTQANANQIVGRFSNNNFLLGPGDILTESMDGGRLRAGWWFANNPNLGIELEYLATTTNRYHFDATSNGNPFIGRPFNNVSNGAEDAYRVANEFPGITGRSGRIDVDAYSTFEGGAVRLRKLICCGESCKTSWLFCSPVTAQSRIDGTLGWRTLELSEGLRIHSVSQPRTGSTIQPNTFLTDVFDTKNIFNGGEIGFMWQGRRGYWTLDALLRTSFGNTSSDVIIRGDSTDAPNVGLLAGRGNIGTYSSNQFSVVPEIGLTLGYQLTQRTRLTAGYTMIYWSNVARPGDQIDVNVNPNWPNTVAIGGVANPSIRAPFLDGIQLSDYFIHGFNAGAEYRW